MGMPIQLDDISDICEICIQEFQDRLGMEFNDRIKNALVFSVDKWETGMHPCMNLYILNTLSKIPFLRREDIIDIGKITIPMEAIVQSLDDTVDIEHRPKETRWNDDVIKFFDMSYMFLKIYDAQRKDYKDSIYSIFSKSEPKVLRVLRNVIKEVLLMTEIPFIEKKAYESILKAVRINDEVGLAVSCYLKRSNAVEIYFHLIRELLPKMNSNSLEYLITLIKFKRAIELIHKDIKDIETDIENESYTPITAFFEKYGLSSKFKLRVNRTYKLLSKNRHDKIADKSIPKNFKDAVWYIEGGIVQETDALNALLNKL